MLSFKTSLKKVKDVKETFFEIEMLL